MRCLTLADALRARGAACYFITREHAGNLIPVIRKRGFGVSVLPHPASRSQRLATDEPTHADWLGVGWQVDADQTLAVLDEKGKTDWMVVDHYALDEHWENAVRSRCGRLMVIDDLADRKHDCDLLVDPGIEAGLSEKYRKLTPPGCVLFVGPHYAMLRPEFDVARASIDASRTDVLPRHLVVLFGGVDQLGATLEALQTIRATAPADIKVDVIVPAANRDKEAIAAFCNNYPGFRMHLATDQIATVFARADLAVGSGGGSTYERLFLRLPSILKPVADNQRAPLGHLARMGLVDLYSCQNELKEKLARAFSQGVSVPCDVVRNGVPAICSAMFDRLVFLKRPMPFDLRRTFRWLQDGTLRTQFLMWTKPERHQHFDYWRKLLHSDSQRVFSIYYGNAHVGNAGIKNIDRDAGHAELWLYLGDPGLKGRGVGSIVLRQLERYIRHDLSCGKVVLHVSRDNLAAYRLYCRAGYAVCPSVVPSVAGFRADLDIVRMEKNL